ncbi:MAG: SlyX family protein [Thalassolituus sp.]
MAQEPTKKTTKEPQSQHDDRINELETRITYLEETVDTLNTELTTLASEYRLAKEALQLMYRKVEQLQGNGAEITNPADEPPPPHY